MSGRPVLELLDVADVDCPACGMPAGAWCVRGDRVQPGPLLACAERVRLVAEHNRNARRAAC